MKTREIAELLGGDLHGDGDLEISGAAAVTTAGAGEITFYEKTDELPETHAGCVIVGKGLELSEGSPAAIIAVRDPKLAFVRISAKFNPPQHRDGHHSSAIIAATADVQASFIGVHVSIGEHAKVGRSAQIHDGVRVGQNASIGERTVIFPNAVIYDGAVIGNDCIIHAGAVIGADGFGYVKNENGEYEKFPQIGAVVIEDRVEIGAGTCVDRGALGETRIGEGTKIDNLVQVGHNVQIGKRCVIAAQTGISGSVVIEDDCVIGGQVGFGDHVRVQSGAVIGSQAGVLPGKIVRPGVWWGTPIQPLDEFKRRHAELKSIGRIREDIKKLKKDKG